MCEMCVSNKEASRLRMLAVAESYNECEAVMLENAKCVMRNNAMTENGHMTKWPNTEMTMWKGSHLSWKLRKWEATLQSKRLWNGYNASRRRKAQTVTHYRLTCNVNRENRNCLKYICNDTVEAESCIKTMKAIYYVMCILILRESYYVKLNNACIRNEEAIWNEALFSALCVNEAERMHLLSPHDEGGLSVLCDLLAQYMAYTGVSLSPITHSGCWPGRGWCCAVQRGQGGKEEAFSSVHGEACSEVTDLSGRRAIDPWPGRSLLPLKWRKKWLPYANVMTCLM